MMNMEVKTTVAFLALACILARASSFRAPVPEVLLGLDPPFPGANQPCYDEERGGTQGFCEDRQCCEGEYFISNYCPSYAAQVKCCFSRNTCGLSCQGGGCGSNVKDLACKILALYEEGKIWLKPEHFNPSGNNPYDGAASLSNIKDTCYGNQAKR